jgi:hypothetical protein
MDSFENLQRQAVKGVSLTVENHGQIEKTFTILSKIFSAESISGELLPELEKMIEKNKKWLQNELSREFQTITEIYTNKSETQIRYEYVEQALSFIEACRRIPEMYKTGAMVAQEQLRTFLKKRASYLQSELEKSFDFIKESTVATQIDATDKGRLMNTYLLEIDSIQQSYPNTLKYVSSDFKCDTILEMWRNTLNEEYATLEIILDENASNENFELLGSNLSCVKSLSKLEPFLGNSKFRDLHCKHDLASLRDSKDDYDSCKDMIEKLEFELLAEAMAKFKREDESEQRYLTNLKLKLNNQLKTILSSALLKKQ